MVRRSVSSSMFELVCMGAIGGQSSRSAALRSSRRRCAGSPGWQLAKRWRDSSQVSPGRNSKKLRQEAAFLRSSSQTGNVRGLLSRERRIR